MPVMLLEYIGFPDLESLFLYILWGSWQRVNLIILLHIIAMIVMFLSIGIKCELYYKILHELHIVPR